MFDFDPICDCGNKVVDNIWPCKHCGRPDPRNCIRPGREVILSELRRHRWPKYGPELSYVWNPYIPSPTEKKP